jgi:RNA polymerase sigma factor (sigma-70 family)
MGDSEQWPLSTTTFCLKARQWLETIKFVALRLSQAQADKIDRSGLLTKAWMQAWHKRDTCRASTQAEARAWVVRIYVNLLHEELGKAYSRRELNAPDEDVGNVRHREEASREDGPERLAELAESRTRVLAALQRLAEPHQTVLTLHYLDGLTMQEIAELLDDSVEAVKKRAERAREALLRELIRKPGSLPGGPTDEP